MLRLFFFFLYFLLFTNRVVPVENKTNDIIVYGGGFESTDFDATHVSETYTASDILKTKAVDFFDFLSNHTSISTQSAYGNKYAPSIDIRGFGLEQGYLAIPIYVDGQKINNIDASGALLGSINLDSIQNIEIIKGSGSVLYGDGATAGVIRITTKNHDNSSIGYKVGNFNEEQKSLSIGKQFDKFGISFDVLDQKNNGIHHKDSNGTSDQSQLKTQNIKFNFNPTKDLIVNLSFTNIETNQIYARGITRSQFFRDPATSTRVGDVIDTEYDDHQESIILDFDYLINSHSKLLYSVDRQDRIYDSRRVPGTAGWENTLDKKYIHQKVNYIYDKDKLKYVFGLEDSNNQVLSSGDSKTVDKNSTAFYFSSNYQLLENFKFNIGARRELTHYSRFGSTENTSKDYNFGYYELGLNYSLNKNTSIFSNYNFGTQTPDIDKFIPHWMAAGTVNLNIVPMRIRTTNLGINHKTDSNYLKSNFYYSELHNEIVYNPNPGGGNENIHRTHKYGLEFFDQYQLSDKLSFSGRYSYTRAIIDSDDLLASKKNLPGVPKNSLLLNLNYELLNHLQLNISHSWKDRFYVLNDFNNTSKKNVSYESTNLNLSYNINNFEYLNNLNLYAGINNIFEQKNGIFTQEDYVYANNFQRTWNVGFKADF